MAVFCVIAVSFQNYLPDHGCSKHIGNVSKLLLDSTARQPKRHSSSFVCSHGNVLMFCVMHGKIMLDLIGIRANGNDAIKLFSELYVINLLKPSGDSVLHLL